jgi:stearoyl-CoA desaturase (delta-9 desaturase)
VALLQHVTWSVNSLCHVFGTRPFATRRFDRASNVWPLALLSLGESWHNMHHSDPSCARHGADPWQIDISAAVIRVFERLGWATGVHWPVAARLDSHRRDQRQAQRRPVLQQSKGLLWMSRGRTRRARAVTPPASMMPSLPATARRLSAAL